MGTSCLIRCGVVLLLADDQRSSFMTNGHLSYMGGSSILRPRLATLAVSRYSGRYVYHTWRSTSYGGLVCPLSEVHYARCVSIVWEPRFPYLALIPASILRGGGQWQDQVRITALTVLVALLIRRCRQATLGIGYLIPKIRGQHRPCCWMQLTHRFHPLPLWLIRPPKHLYMIPPPPPRIIHHIINHILCCYPPPPPPTPRKVPRNGSSHPHLCPPHPPIPIPIVSSSPIMPKITHEGGGDLYILISFLVFSAVVSTSSDSRPPRLVASAVPSHVIIVSVTNLLLLPLSC